MKGSRTIHNVGHWMVALAALLPLTAAATLATASPAYHVIRTAKVAGDGGWDFLSLDPAGHQLYVTHANSVQVLDARNLKLLGTVPDVPRPHGVVALPDLGRGYISSGDPGSVVVFDLRTFKKLGEVATSKDCDVILHDPASGRIFTFNGDSGKAFAIDPTTLKVVGSLELGGSPEVAVADGKGLLYDNLSDKHEILKIDAKTFKILAHWDISPGQDATGLAVDAVHGRLFAGCRNKLLVVLDTATGKVLQTLPIGEHVDSTAFDPGRGLVFNSCGDGTLSVVEADGPDHYRVLENAKTEAGARTLALDPATGRVYTDAAQSVALAKADKEHPWKRRILPGTFHVLELGR